MYIYTWSFFKADSSQSYLTCSVCQWRASRLCHTESNTCLLFHLQVLLLHFDLKISNDTIGLFSGKKLFWAHECPFLPLPSRVQCGRMKVWGWDWVTDCCHRKIKEREKEGSDGGQRGGQKEYLAYENHKSLNLVAWCLVCFVLRTKVWQQENE